jgi:hypothetical protein
MKLTYLSYWRLLSQLSPEEKMENQGANHAARPLDALLNEIPDAQDRKFFLSHVLRRMERLAARDEFTLLPLDWIM